MTFRETIVFVCNGKEQLEMPAGSIMGINAVCSGTTLILHRDFAQRNSLFDILHRRCGRSRPRHFTERFVRRLYVRPVYFRAASRWPKL